MKMTGWKVFSVLNALVVISTIVGPRAGSYDSPFELAGIIISIPAALGLILYAFGKHLFSSTFWKVFAWVFAGFSLVAIGLFLKQTVATAMADGFKPVGMLGAIAVVVCLQFFTWLALQRLSKPVAGVRAG
jgi:hypothetical protein